ncbi:matrixin family metalloprotease [Methanolapillus africanus]
MDWMWEDPNIILTYTLEGEGALPLEWIEPLDAAQKTWNDADSGATFSTGENGNNVYLTQMPAGYANKIGLVWISMPPNPSNAGVESAEYNSSDVPLRYKYVEILFNSNVTDWKTNGSRSGPDVQGVATHELGHVLGLDHNTVVDATQTIMVPSGSDTVSLRKLKSDDLLGLHALYPKSDVDAGDLVDQEPLPENMENETVANVMVVSGNNTSGNEPEENDGQNPPEESGNESFVTRIIRYLQNMF